MGACLFSRGNMEYKDSKKYCVGCVYFYKEGENEKQETESNIIALVYII